MKIVKVAIEKLIDADYNPRKDLKKEDPEYIKLKASIKEFGIVRPIVINKDYQIIGGHQTKKVLKDLKYKDVDCIIVDIDESKEKALNIALNKISGEWDQGKLFDVLGELKIKEDDFLLTGFDFSEYDELFKEFDNEGYNYSKSGQGSHGKIKEDNFDFSGKEEIETDIKIGDVFELGEHRLMCGDSTNKIHANKLLKKEKVKFLFTSPPYSDLRSYGLDKKDLDIKKIVKFIDVFRKYTNYQIVNLGLKREEFEIVQYWDEYIKKAKEVGYKLLGWNVWHKGVGSVCQQQSFFPIAHEWIFIFGTEFFEINKTVRKKEEYIIEKGKERKAKRRQPQKDDIIEESTTGDMSHELKKLESVLTVHCEKGVIRSEHPAVFPIEFPGEYIKSMSNENDIVLDCFGGSGSTLIACEQLNRKCFMMEISPKYCQVIINRWEKYTEKKAVKIN